MCVGCGKGKYEFSIKYDQSELDELSLKPPPFLKKVGSKIVKFILNYVHHRLADTIFLGGPIYTMDPQHPMVEAVALQDGVILGAGTELEMMTFRNGDKTRIIDLKGRTLLPGFV